MNGWAGCAVQMVGRSGSELLIFVQRTIDCSPAEGNGQRPWTSLQGLCVGLTRPAQAAAPILWHSNRRLLLADSSLELSSTKAVIKLRVMLRR